jgi:hypothetical protein
MKYLYLVENAREGGRHVQRVIKPNFPTISVLAAEKWRNSAILQRVC